MTLVWTNEGVIELQKIITGLSTNTINKFIVGKDDTAPVITNTALNDKNTDFTAKAFDVGYPSVDTPTKQTTIRGTVSSTEANNVNLAENGLVNSADDVLFAHCTHTGIAKNLSTEVIYEWKFKITNE